MPNVPLVTVLVAVHNGEPYIGSALVSVLRQSVGNLELLVVDDASTDETPNTLAAVVDDRLRTLRSQEQLGLAASLNRGLGEARGEYVARIDADDAALADWLERSIARLRSGPDLGFVGAGVLDITSTGSPREVHVMESGRAAMRWRALFSSPVFHNTVVMKRDVLEGGHLRYDTSYGESEDYELWTRVLALSEGDSIGAPLVLHRLHREQASRRRGDLQRSLAHEISLRQLEALAPEMPRRNAEFGRAVGVAAEVSPENAMEAADSFLELLDRFAAAYAYSAREHEVVRQVAARSLARLAIRSGGQARLRILRRATALDSAFAGRVVSRRAKRRRRTRTAHRDAVFLLRSLSMAPGGEAIPVTAVFPEPTPYRSPLLDRVAALPEIDLTVVYAADTVVRRTWRVEPQHRAVFLRGIRVPGAQRIVHHDYPITLGVVGALSAAHPAVVVVSGWSTFASQAAIAWCGIKRVPYVLLVESHDEGPRASWRRAVKGSVVPPVVRNAAGVLVTGTLARNSMIARGAPPERVRVFANTVDVEAFGERADGLAPRREELRRALGAGPDDVVVISVARLGLEKGLDVLVRATVAASDPRLLLVLAGDGPERPSLEKLATELEARVAFLGETEWERIVELYVAGDVFALLSSRETWAVVVNEAAACGLPLVLSDRVGAAHDLLQDGENGALVLAGDVTAASNALRALAGDPELRRAQGARSRELARDWGYGPSVDGFLAAVREAVAGQS